MNYTRRLATVFLVHAPSDHDFARHLAEFLELGCNLTCYVDDGQIREHQDLIAKAEEGLCADVLLLLLSPSSSPPRWIRERWEPVLFDQAKQERVEVVAMNPAPVPSALAQAREEFLAMVASIRPELHRYCARLTGP